jgi:hypothetical protein
MSVLGVTLSMSGPLASASGSRAIEPTIKICNTLHAGKWKMGSKSGNTWIVTVTSPATCGFAERIGTALTRQKVDVNGNFSKSPRGYVCAGSQSSAQSHTILCHAHFGTGAIDIMASSSY